MRLHRRGQGPAGKATKPGPSASRPQRGASPSTEHSSRAKLRLSARNRRSGVAWGPAQTRGLHAGTSRPVRRPGRRAHRPAGGPGAPRTGRRDGRQARHDAGAAWRTSTVRRKGLTWPAKTWDHRVCAGGAERCRPGDRHRGRRGSGPRSADERDEPGSSSPAGCGNVPTTPRVGGSTVEAVPHTGAAPGARGVGTAGPRRRPRWRGCASGTPGTGLCTCHDGNLARYLPTW